MPPPRTETSEITDTSPESRHTRRRAWSPHRICRAAVRPHIFLPRMHLAAHSAVLPLYAHVQPLRTRSHQEARPNTRTLAGHTSHTALPSMGRQRIRPRAVMRYLQAPSTPPHTPPSAMKTTLTPPPLPAPIPADIHTHRQGCDDGSAVVNITLGTVPPCPPTLFSAGIHPWKADKATEDTWSWLEDALERPNAYAVGEAGLDLRHDPSIDVQLPVFKRQAFMADDLSKPLIIHLVGAYDRLYEVQKEVMQRNGGHTPLWIIHGFRGRPELARQLLDHGMYISLGARFNPETVGIIPPQRLLAETDDEPSADISDIRRALGL